MHNLRGFSIVIPSRFCVKTMQKPVAIWKEVLKSVWSGAGRRDLEVSYAVQIRKEIEV